MAACAFNTTQSLSSTSTFLPDPQFIAAGRAAERTALATAGCSLCFISSMSSSLKLRCVLMFLQSSKL